MGLYIYNVESRRIKKLISVYHKIHLIQEKNPLWRFMSHEGLKIGNFFLININYRISLTQNFLSDLLLMKGLSWSITASLIVSKFFLNSHNRQKKGR